jgi:hypothetical protein
VLFPFFSWPFFLYSSLLSWLSSLTWPHTPHDVNIWILVLALLYLIVAVGISFKTGKRRGGQTIFEAAAFASSILLLAEVIDEETRRALGDQTQYLIIAGLAGAFYAIQALF